MFAFPVTIPSDLPPIEYTGTVQKTNETQSGVCDLLGKSVSGQNNSRFIYLNHLSGSSNNMNEIVPSYEEVSLEQEYTDLYNDCVEELGEVTLKENKERSTTTTTCYDVMHEGKKAGELQKLGPTAKTMLMTSKRSYGLFEEVNGGKFPDEQRITKNIQEKDQTRTVSLILPGPTYENDNLITGLAIDNGESAGQSVDITDPAVKGKGILSIQNGLLHFSHADEMSQEVVDQLIADKRDLCTLPSIKRPGKNINSPLLEKVGGVSKNRRFLVQMQDGTSGVLTLNNRNATQVESILSDPQFSRVLYCDGVGNAGQMDGGRKEEGTTKQLQYEHHTNGKNTPEVKGNMPAIFVIYNQPN